MEKKIEIKIEIRVGSFERKQGECWGLGFYLKGEEDGEGGEHEDGQITLPHGL